MIIPAPTLASCASNDCELLVSPIPRPRPRPISIQMPRRRRVALLDHGKPNSKEILVRAARLLEERGVEVRAPVVEKRWASRPMPDEILAELKAEHGLVLCGVSDCGSCSAGTALDAVLLHGAGVAGVAVLTAPFEAVLARVLTYYETDRAVPLITIEHPTQNVDDATLDQRARAIAAMAEAMFAEAGV